jgi:PadR family transcriptional regulator PadR
MTGQEIADEPTERQINITREMLNVIILKILNVKPTYGYKLMSTVKKTFGTYFGASTIYPLLAKLEKDGDIISQWIMEKDRPRKTYSITAKGQETITRAQNDFNIFCKKINAPLDDEK